MDKRPCVNERSAAGRAPERGFTVVEAMMVVFIIAILAAIAAPNMNDLIRTQRVRSLSYDLFADLTYARSEAIARGHRIAMQREAGGWVNGWTINDTVSGELLRQEGPRTNVDFTATSGTVVFQPTGRTTAGTVSFEIKPTDAAPDNQKRCVRIDPSGRPRSITGVC